MCLSRVSVLVQILFKDKLVISIHYYGDLDKYCTCKGTNGSTHTRTHKWYFHSEGITTRGELSHATTQYSVIHTYIYYTGIRHSEDVVDKTTYSYHFHLYTLYLITIYTREGKK